MAMVHGVIVGVTAVAVIGLLFVVTNGKDPVGAIKEDIPTSGPAPVDKTTTDPVAKADESLQLFAKQHGAFSTVEAAETFQAEDPTLAKAAIVMVDKTYFIWSEVGLNEGDIEVSAEKGSFRKVLNANASSCAADGVGKLQQVLAETDIAKIKKLIPDKKAESKEKSSAKQKEFEKHITAATAFTDDLEVIRLLLLSHYAQPDKCVKITF
ncbi:hypothetical protein FITA111629_04045 [Filibacter tadaridae]|uniref:Uncharacterized protein n=2 Tax=Filibacter tadaridae TaxID=2483811 RepID=A0A3P5XQD3_9BACL|nr:hypothetical protein FILTAD_02821 [Filibacter tadaridae]